MVKAIFLTSILKVQHNSRLHRRHGHAQTPVRQLDLQIDDPQVVLPAQSPASLKCLEGLRVSLHLLHDAGVQLQLLFFEGRPELRRDYHRGQRPVLRVLGVLFYVLVDAFRVLHVLQHHFAVVELRVAETQLEQFEVPYFLFRVTRALRKQAISQKRPVFVDEELFAAVDADQHRNDVGGASDGEGFRRVRVDGIGHPFLPVVGVFVGAGVLVDLDCFAFHEFIGQVVWAVFG